MGPQEAESLLYSEGRHYSGKEVAHRMDKDPYQLYIWHSVTIKNVHIIKKSKHQENK